MYKLAPGIKNDPQRRWNLPDRIFFGHGACHILAGVCLKDDRFEGFHAERVVPANGFSGNHVYITNGDLAFDFHGYSVRSRLIAHHKRNWARVSAPGWSCDIRPVAFGLLSTRDLNRYKMRGPDQYLFDPVPRAQAFVARICHSKAREKAARDLI